MIGVYHYAKKKDEKEKEKERERERERGNPNAVRETKTLLMIEYKIAIKTNKMHTK